MCHGGGAHAVLRKYAELWSISSEHFDPYAKVREGGPARRRPLQEILVQNSDFSRGHLKERLYQAGLKHPVCEQCGQGEDWQARKMAMILDHANGISNDNRLENLRILCPNCAATLDTHCARARRVDRVHQACQRCGRPFMAKKRGQRYCSRQCGYRDRLGRPQPGTRKVDRPPYAQLLREVHAIGFEATGRRYGVSGNAVRKWIRAHERERELTGEAA